jgi:hypothetical protein
MNRRRAVSLIELLLAMSACTVILTMSATLIHRVLHVQSKSRAIFDGERAAMRLSDQFRHDVHAAAAAETNGASLGAGVILRLQLEGGETVEYRRAEGTVLRVVLDGDATQAREQFNFPADIDLTVRKESPGLVTLSITSPLPDSAAAMGANRPLPAGPLSLQSTARLNRFAAKAATAQEDAP